MRKLFARGFIFGVWWVGAILLGAAEQAPQIAQPNPTFGLSQTTESGKPTIWQDGAGEGFRSGVQTLTVEAGTVYGFPALGGDQSHDLALVSLSYGHMLGGVVGADTWHRGNWEIRIDLFGGSQYDPTSDWVIGLAPHLRYDFATGTRWIPYVDAGAGVTGTSIGPPDLSNTFEFNLQTGVGMHWFVSDKLALTFDARFFHASCAGLSSPNLGLNGVMTMFGLTRFF